MIISLNYFPSKAHSRIIYFLINEMIFDSTIWVMWFHQLQQLILKTLFSIQVL